MKTMALPPTVAEINDNKRLFPKFTEFGPHKAVMAANDANFDTQHLSEPLSEFIAGFADPDGLDMVLEAAVPSVPTSESFEYFTHDDKESFQLALNDEDIREIHGDFGSIRPTGDKVESRLQNKGLTMVLDNDRGGENPAVQRQAVANLRQRLLRSELYRLEVLLEANDTATTPNWGPTNTSADPDGDIITDIDLGGDARGINSNVVLIGGGAWVNRIKSLGPTDARSSSPERGFNEAQLRDLYNVDRVVRSKARYQSSATAKSKIVGNKVFTYYAGSLLNEGDPSNVKRFYLPFSEGEMFRVYVTPLLKRTLVTLEHYSLVALTSALGIRKIAPTYT